MTRSKGDGPASGERRTWERYKLENPTTLTVRVNGASYRCVVEDISVGGARLRLVGGLDADQPLALEHPVAGEFGGQAVWSKDDEVGVRFELPAQTLEHLLKCVAVILNPDEVASKLAAEAAAVPARRRRSR
jgi:hypothetical protein